MSTTLDQLTVRCITEKTGVPIIFKDYVKKWPVSQWTLEKWCSVFGEQVLPFRCMSKNFVSDEPCWERRCKTKPMTFRSFCDSLASSHEWMYFDYKHLNQWFVKDSELFKEVSWKQFGFPEKDAGETTLWIGSSGAHTPAHQDTYGYNIVAQVHGKKHWILFPPDTVGLKPTRVPYEESSVYSQLNFYCPSNLDVFNGLSGARMVELSAGDALLVPRGWWHYVQNVDPVNITLNIWLPHEKDDSMRVSEALTKIFVAQICKDLPQETSKLIVNPNEDDVSDTPLAVLFLQLDAVTKTYLDKKRKQRRVKRQKTEENPSTFSNKDINIQEITDDPANTIEMVKSVTSNDIIEHLKHNIKEYVISGNPVDEDDIDGDTSSLCLTKAVIDSFSQNNVIDLVKQNLFARLN